jgi:glycosyltransferase involved in cell wall biosynthesis
VRILFLTPLGEIGGAERVLLDMIASLRRTGRELDIHVIVGAGGSLVAALNEAGAKVTLLRMQPTLNALGENALVGSTGRRSPFRAALATACAAGSASKYAVRLRRAVRSLRPDIVHSNGNKFHLLSGLALGRKWPVIWHLHDFLGERPLTRRLLRRVSRRVGCAIAVSEAVARDARSVLGPARIEVVRNAVDTERFAPGPADGNLLDRLAGLPPARNVLRVGLMATYARWKGQDLFLEAAARLRPSLDLRFFIIGGPIYQTSGSQFSADELRRRIGELGLQERVGLIPFQSDPAAVYRALDVVVHASTRPEPFGLTIAEAMACARPVIVSATGGAAELFTHDRDAFGIPPGKACQLADAIHRLAANADLRLRLGETARQTALQQFDRTRLGPHLLEIYRRLKRG